MDGLQKKEVKIPQKGDSLWRKAENGKEQK